MQNVLNNDKCGVPQSLTCRACTTSPTQSSLSLSPGLGHLLYIISPSHCFSFAFRLSVPAGHKMIDPQMNVISVSAIYVYV